MTVSLDVRGDLRLAMIDAGDPTGKAILRAARTAAAEGDLVRNRPERRDRALDRLRRLIQPLTTDDLNALAFMWMISDQWNGATGEGGIWAVASEIVNDESRAILKTRPAFECW